MFLLVKDMTRRESENNPNPTPLVIIPQPLVRCWKIDVELKEILELSSVILTSLGGSAAIIFGFSSRLGKGWANHLMEKKLDILKN